MVGLHLNLTYDDFVSTYIIEHDGLHSCLPIDVGVCVLGGRENMLQIVQKRKKGKERKGKHVAVISAYIGFFSGLWWNCI